VLPAAALATALVAFALGLEAALTQAVAQDLEPLAQDLAAADTRAVASGGAESSGPHHGHEPLDLDRGLEWDGLLDRTVLNYPRYLELEARRQEAEAWRRLAGSPLGGQPSLSLSYRSDAGLDAHGFAEYESGVSLPLWRAGQRGAAGGVGTSAEREVGAAAAALRWELAGKLRETLWSIESATNEVELARDAVAAATELERIVSRRHAAGDLPLEDTLLARSTLLEREAALVESRAALVDAERAYQALTGLAARPVTFAETLTARADFDATHPLLVLADAEVERARAERQFAAAEAKGKTVLSIGPRRQRDPLTDFFTDSFGVAVSVPFGGAAHAAPAIAASTRAVAEASARRAAIERDLETRVHEAVHSLEVTENALRLADEQADIAARRARMGRTAFESGEITLADLVRREEAARSATREAARLRIQRGRTIAAINQAMGELP
jgi:outer membrane protein TolC